MFINRVMRNLTDASAVVIDFASGLYKGASGLLYSSFEAMVAAGEASFSRASLVKWYDDAGNMTSFANDAPVIDSVGMRLDVARTNIATNSEVAVNGSGMVTSSNAIVAPDGVMSGEYMRETTSSSTHRVALGGSGFTFDKTPGYQTWSFFVAPFLVTRYLNVTITDSALNGVHVVLVDLINNTVNSGSGSLNVSGAHGIQVYANGWRRVWGVMYSTSALTGCGIRVHHTVGLGTTTTFVGNGFSLHDGDIFGNSNEAHVATGGTLTAGTFYSTFTTTSGDAYIVRGQSFAGASFPFVILDFEAVTPTAGVWEGKLYWETAGHGYSEAYRAQISDPGLVAGQRTALVWDMSANADWNASTITGLRYDLFNAAGQSCRIRARFIQSSLGSWTGFWGLQIVDGDLPGDYISTGSASGPAVTRAADSATLDAPATYSTTEVSYEGGVVNMPAVVGGSLDIGASSGAPWLGRRIKRIRLIPTWGSGDIHADWRAGMDFVGGYYKGADRTQYASQELMAAAAQAVFVRENDQIGTKADGTLQSFANNVAANTALGHLADVATNLVAVPNDLTNAYWTLGGVTVAGGRLAPDGSSTACLLQGTTSSEAVRNTNAMTVTSGVTYSHTWFVKRGNFDWLRISIGDSTAGTNSIRVWVNLATGTVGSVGASGTGWSTSSTTVTPVGNGYYAVGINFTPGATTCYVFALSAASDGSTNRANVGGGAGVGTQYYLWSALLERSARNIEISSNDLSSAHWVKTSSSVTGGQTDLLGGTSAYRVDENGSGALIRTSTISVVNATTYTYSCYLKRGNFDWQRVMCADSSSGSNSARCWVNLATGIVSTVSTTGTGWTVSGATITPVASGWYRLTLTFTTGATSFVGLHISAAADGSNTRADVGSGAGIGGQHYLWGAQLELGSIASSLIQTTGSTAPRRATIATMAIPVGASSITVNYGVNSSVALDPAVIGSSLNFGSSSGGPWVGSYIRSIVVI